MSTAIELKSARLQALQARDTSLRDAAHRAAQLHDQEVMQARTRRMDAARFIAMRADMKRAAEAGMKGLMVLTFPADVCDDRGRAINSTGNSTGSSGGAGWSATLRGEAADLYAYFDKELRAEGYSLSAAVQNFPNGMPGDIGMTIAWG